MLEVSTVEEGGGGSGAVVMLTVFTGRLAAPLRPGERLKLSWRLLLTPVRDPKPSPSPSPNPSLTARPKSKPNPSSNPRF